MNPQDESTTVSPLARLFKSLNDLQILILILLAALAIRLIFFTGVFAVDDFNYLRNAAMLWKGNFHLEQISYWHGTRFLVFMPISLFFALSGVSEFTAVLWPLIASICVIILIFKIGKILHGREAGLYSAMLACFLPVMVNGSTWVTPGPVIQLIMTVSVLLFLEAENSTTRRGLLFFCSGAVFAMFPFAGNIAVLSSAFFVLSFLFYKRGRLSGYLGFLSGAALIILAELLFYHFAAGDPFMLLKISGKILSREATEFQPLFYLRSLTVPLYSQGGIFYLFLLALTAAVILRKRELILVCSWFVFTWLLMEFGSSSLTEYRPLFKQARYLSVLAPPAVLCGGMALAEIRSIICNFRGMKFPKHSGSIVVIFILGIFTASSLLYLHRSRSYMRIEKKFVNTAAGIIRKYEGQVIYTTHWLWNSRVGFFLGYKDEYLPSGYAPYRAFNPETADPGSKNLYIQMQKKGEQLKKGILLFDEKLYEISSGQKKGAHMLKEKDIPLYLGEFVMSKEPLANIDYGENRRLSIYRINKDELPVSFD